MCRFLSKGMFIRKSFIPLVVRQINHENISSVNIENCRNMILKLRKDCFTKKLVNAVNFLSMQNVQKRKLRTFHLKSKQNNMHTENENVTICEKEKKIMNNSGDFFEEIKKADFKLFKKMKLEEGGKSYLCRDNLTKDSYKNANFLDNPDEHSETHISNDAMREHCASDFPSDQCDYEQICEEKREDFIPDKYKFIFERPKHFAHIDDEPIIRRPGCIIDIKTLMRNNWTFPAVGFNSKLEIPIYKFESDENDDNMKYVTVPNDIFGLPIRSDILHKCYYFYRTALAGYTERMQLYKWEWPGSTKKYRSQKKSGKARMNWRKTCGRYLGVKNHPLRPFDQRTKINRKLLWKGMKILLSAKFAQDQIKVVDNFLIKSHKTKYTVKYLRNILGKNCNSALLVHEGKTDVNDNFLWACANIASIKRENVEGVNIYNLLKYRYVIFTYKALKNIIYELKIYPHKMKWLPTYATPDNSKAPKPVKVKNWNILWLEKKKRNDFSYFDKDALKKRIEQWKWSSDLKGPLKVKKHDPYKNFVLTKFQCNDPPPEYVKYEYLFNVDDDFDDVNDYENNLGLIDEILNDDECLGDISALSSPLSAPSGTCQRGGGRHTTKRVGNAEELSDDEEDLDSDENERSRDDKQNEELGDINSINFDNIEG
ncbi:mitochondrial ribosomal protein L4 precursor, putative [Plasmodium ovale wallikeri]|uniref:Large ribosomal subunit protein uL4m n=1 Tax=Plasmodium ovale wallikeri TaxID=864142 RepID=A0A1A8YKV7_PLAOA|nr:mitochondrial ribosomal protein L4 precursor, putative [Plasmodium ovale wallikeri]SBT32688.1 mitochondrial ribosomal protein L4 precursor, putative [Plasmodium ovale wallikeri]